MAANLKLFGNMSTLASRQVPLLTSYTESDGSSVSLHSEMANIFNDYFSSVFTQEDASFQTFRLMTHHDN